jgi:hypothetical protein
MDSSGYNIAMVLIAVNFSSEFVNALGKEPRAIIGVPIALAIFLSDEETSEKLFCSRKGWVREFKKMKSVF